MRVALILTVLLASPAFAQGEDAPPRWSFEDLLGGLIDEQLRPFMEEFSGALGALAEQVGDLSAYHPPEILPNGDIILRRKQDAPPLPEAGDSVVDL